MNPLDEDISRDQAIRWFARMRDDRRTAADEIAFERWLNEDPRHEQQYERLQKIWKNVEGAADTAEMKPLRAAALNDSRIGALARDSHTPYRSSLRRMVTAVATVAAIAIVMLLGYPYLPIERSYETAIGERRTIVLPDGSELTLNTATRIHVRYDLRLRRIDLEHGQALFKVASNRWRPFLVDAGDRTIRALGTEFDVYRKADEVRVALIEGRISITPDTPAPDETESRQSRNGTAEADDFPSDMEEIVLTAGRSVLLTPRGAVEIPAVRLEETTAWLHGRLVFNDQPLSEAVSEINRYSARKIVVVDDGLAALRVNGVFSTDRVDSFLEAVRMSLPVVVQRASDDTLVIAADPARAAEAPP